MMTMNDQLLDKKYKPLCVIYIKLVSDLFYKKDLESMRKVVQIFEEMIKIDEIEKETLMGDGVLFDTYHFLHDTVEDIKKGRPIDFEWLHYRGSFTKEDLEGN